MRHGIRARVIAATVSVIVGLALARPALADDTNAGQRCRPIHHGTDEFAVCLYRDGPAFDDLPLLAPENAVARLDAFFAASEDAVCVKPTTVEMPFVQCYFRRDIFEADEGNPAWSTMGPEADLAQAVIYSPTELTPLESSEPMPAPEATNPWPEYSPAPLPEYTPAPPQPSETSTPTPEPQ
jgi:hypothetical protein